MKPKSALLFLILILAACQTDSKQDDSPVNSNLPLVISEVMAGVEGNNNYEFIELHNTGNSIIDLDGITLWYRLATSDEDMLVYEWTARRLLAGHGHYLLSRESVDIGILPNATFSQALNTKGGGILLRDPEGRVIDSVGWGNAPAEFTEESPASVLENGKSLERHPGGEAGNGQDRNDNSKDFFLTSTPSPQNSGSIPTPSEDQPIAISLSGPPSVEPGSEFSYTLTIVNVSTELVPNITIEMIIPLELIVKEHPESVILNEQELLWEVGDLGAGDEYSETLHMEAPWAYLDFLIDNLFASSGDSDITVFASPVLTRIEGGIIPIGTARGLLGAELTVEGITTMYTGGYYAGGGNVKFYIEDDSGGLQVQVFDGEGVVSVPIGTHVRVKGMMSVYRGSVQIVPNSVPGDVEILEPSPDQDTPDTIVTLRQAANDFNSLPGRLVRVEGTVSRVEEFSYSYEMDLVDDEGQLLRLYIDKLTEMTVETIEPGHIFRASGILEVRDGNIMLYPRLQSDLEEVFPPVLLVNVDAPNTILPGDSFDVTITAINHSPEAVEDLMIAASLPAGIAELEAVYNDGSIEGEEIVWFIPGLEGNGESVSVGFKLRASADAGQIIINTYPKQPIDVALGESETWQIFIGATVPIWAIQGDGFASPYVLDEVTTSGVVTGIFPSLGGFWIQSPDSDANSMTSEGLFVNIGERDADLSIGDFVEVTGDVREISQQTMLEIFSLEDINVNSHDEPLPDPIELSPPIDDQASRIYYESLEGMLVEVRKPAVAVSPTSRYGEYSVVLLEHAIERIWRGESSGHIIMVDDGTADVHYDSSTLPYAIQTGDQVSNLYGPLAYTYGHYKIEPLDSPSITKSSITLAELPPLAADEFSIMTWNVENLFDILDPHPTDPPLPRRAEYELSLTKVANTIIAAGVPTIVGLQEVEHLGILEDLADHALLQTYEYMPVLVEGTDSRGIDVGYLVRGDRADILDVQQYIAPEGLTSRPPLLIQVQLNSSQGSFELFLINNHFTSMSGGVLATEPRRSAQAAWNVTVLEEVLGISSDANVAILGDLNSFYDSKPLDILREAGLEHVFDILEPAERYTYIFEGASQSLDHILVTPSVMELIESVDILHINADFPPADPDDPSPIHKSDHDPVIARFRFPEG
jgi:hypothetical protein